MFLEVSGQSVKINSRRYSAEFFGASPVSFLQNTQDGNFCAVDTYFSPIEFLFFDGEVMGIDPSAHQDVRQLSTNAARVTLQDAHFEGQVLICLDPRTGDLCIVPRGRSKKPGLLAIRWNVSFCPDVRLVLPCHYGMQIQGTSPLPEDTRLPWPMLWKAQLAIAEKDDRSMMIHCQDHRYQHKALNLLQEDEGVLRLGFESEHLGPVYENHVAGGIEWRINAYDGDWREPADRFRKWMEEAYKLSKKRQGRPPWVDEISFSFQWAKADEEVLDALVEVHPPNKTLIHLAFGWRHHPYDRHYPDYTPNDSAKEFMSKANKMGFKTMLHFNYWACCQEHPKYPIFRDWQVRDVQRNQRMRWEMEHPAMGSFHLAYIHPGLERWRRTLIDDVLRTCEVLKPQAIFLDQTLMTPNVSNGPVETMNTMEGMCQLQKELSEVRPDLVLAGEGVSELAFQFQSFAQAHIDIAPNPELRVYTEHVPLVHPICSYLWRDHTRLVGYWHLHPSDPKCEVALEMYRKMEALPTFTGAGILRYLGKDLSVVDRDRDLLKSKDPYVLNILS
jgi:hypothetical protein